MAKAKRKHTVTHYSLADFLERLVPTAEGKIVILPVSVRDEIVDELRQYEALVAEQDGEESK